MNRVLGPLVLTALLAIVGCGELPPETDSAGGPPAPAAPAPAPPADPSEAAPDAEPADEQPASAQDAPVQQPATTAEMPAPSAPNAPLGEVAGVGVGAKGQNYGGPGFVTTPVEAYFRTEERIAFEVQIPKAMQLYKAEHNNKGPKSHQEFMSIIIRENGVRLPELPAGEEYVYDPATEQLFVKKPAE